MIELVEYAERKISYEEIILLEERKRSRDQAFIDGYLRKVRTEIKQAFP